MLKGFSGSLSAEAVVVSFFVIFEHPGPGQFPDFIEIAEQSGGVTRVLWTPNSNRHREFVDGSYIGPGEGRYRDRSEWEIHRNTHEAMISDEEAEAIFRVRDKQKRK
jgi:hypothetical protein